MNKKVKSIAVMLGLFLSIGVVANASVGVPVEGQSGAGTRYSGYVQGSKNIFACWVATNTSRKSGYEDVYAYVEVVNSQGYVIGAGAENTGADYAYSGTVTRNGGKNAYGSVGTANETSKTFAHLY